MPVEGVEVHAPLDAAVERWVGDHQVDVPVRSSNASARCQTAGSESEQRRKRRRPASHHRGNSLYHGTHRIHDRIRYPETAHPSRRARPQQERRRPQHLDQWEEPSRPKCRSDSSAWKTTRFSFWPRAESMPIRSSISTGSGGRLRPCLQPSSQGALTWKPFEGLRPGNSGPEDSDFGGPVTYAEGAGAACDPVDDPCTGGGFECQGDPYPGNGKSEGECKNPNAGGGPGQPDVPIDGPYWNVLLISLGLGLGTWKLTH